MIRTIMPPTPNKPGFNNFPGFNNQGSSTTEAGPQQLKKLDPAKSMLHSNDSQDKGSRHKAWSDHFWLGYWGESAFAPWTFRKCFLFPVGRRKQ